MRAIHAVDHGAPEVLKLVDLETPEPGPGEVRIDVEAIGVNYTDLKQRSGGSRHASEPPFIPGIEAAGTVDAIGEGVDYGIGARVAAYVGGGAYAEKVVVDADQLFEVPDGLSFEAAAGFPVQFITAYNSLHGWGGLESGDRVLIHAAAGGVGTAAVQLADVAGAEIFATASTDEKRAFATDLGADHAIDYTTDDVAEEIDRLTDGEGVDLVLDGVGGEAFNRSLEALSPFGRIVSIGSASGEEGAPNPTVLRDKNASVVGYHLGKARAHDPESIEPAPSAVLDLIADGEIEVIVGETFPLSEAAAAHAFIESRDSVGKVLLLP